MKNKYIYISLLTVVGWHAEALAQDGARQAPRLVVSITIDQLRSDYLETFAPLYGTNGFKKLLAEGVVYENATYPFFEPDRASAISSVVAGTTPYYHSIVGTRWLDKATLRPVLCTDSQKQDSVPSPVQMAVSTMGDELKVATHGEAKVFAVAPFEDAAILSAGHAADGAVWLDTQTGRWITSQYYMNEVPQWLLSFNELYSYEDKSRKREWKPLVVQQKPDFRYTFKGDRRHQDYQTSGLVNADITELALHSQSALAMGYDGVTDLLCLTYYAGTYGHRPVSASQKELQDTYLRLDREIATLVTQLETRIGKGQVMFVVTSTGYSDPEETDYTAYRIPTGTFYINRTASLLNMYFGALWGQGRYVEGCYGRQLFFNHQLLESKRISMTDATQRAQEFVAQMAGVRNVYTRQQLLGNYHEQIAKIRNSFNPQRNGDLLIEVAPGWHLQNEETGEDLLSQASAITFPILIYGNGLTAQRVQTPVTVDRIAPTVAKTIRIRAPNACASEPLF